MRIVISSVILLLLFFFSVTINAYSKPKDVYGWDNVRWGMSSVEVKKMLGENIEKRNIRVDEKENMYSEFQLRGVEFGRVKFRASLWMDMKSDKLVRIVFIPENEPSKYQWAEAFISTEKFLNKEYGIPNLVKTSNDPGTSAERVWNFPSTEIELSYLRLEGSELLLLVFSHSTITPDI